MEFNTEASYRKTPVHKRQSWPIKLALRCGAKTEASASVIVILISIILIIVTITIYRNIFFSSPSNDIDIGGLSPEFGYE